MRLLNANTLEVVEFMDHDVPDFVILSHTWVAGQEVTFQDMQKKEGLERSGYDKIKRTCALALENGYGYAWVDTCCIDKTSSAELSEAINSMMSWYERSEICYTYLADVSPGTNIHEPESLFAKSRWFERGWTLQELIAPSRLIFLYDDWSVMSERDEIVDLITQITGIDQAILSPPTADCLLQSRLHAASIAEKMSWASQRQTTRIEDTAYCLLGIFGINMPLLYGEGENAFMRLQEEIMKRSDDQTLLAWYPEAGPADSGVLATSPAAFANCKDFIPCDVGMPTPPFQMTKKGLRIEMPLSSDSFSVRRYGLLQCRTKRDPTTMIAIPLASCNNNLYVRMTSQPLVFLSYQYWRAWPFTSLNLLPSFSFTSSIVQPPTYTVFLESIPENFYISEVYPPNQSQQPDPRIIMTGTPEDEGQVFSRVAMVLIKSSINDVEPFVVRIMIESPPVEGRVWTGSEPEATVTFVRSLGGTFFDGVSIASSWDSCTHPIFPYWMRRQEKGYTIRRKRKYHCGKTLFVLELTEEGVDRKRPDWQLFDGDDLADLHNGWKQTLQRLNYHARSSAHTVVRSLALSPWMFTFAVDSLIWRALRRLRLMKYDISKQFARHTLGGGVALSLSVYLFQPQRWKLENLIRALSLPEAFHWVRANSLDFVLFYFCCKLLPSELLEAILEKNWNDLASVLVGIGLRLAVAENGANVATILA
ncbi:beta transducin [Fusarium mexicanum]|uniref:Beta transducin n=1 Tax=Fusarium mexicanum TaxID=751941 RepID=A0A8H5MTW2_9HYPO|nr:beta transducin [Fusarium mexicanum]